MKSKNPITLITTILEIAKMFIPVFTGLKKLEVLAVGFEKKNICWSLGTDVNYSSFGDNKSFELKNFVVSVGTVGNAVIISVHKAKSGRHSQAFKIDFFKKEITKIN